jgi:hypothetical protein
MKSGYRMLGLKIKSGFAFFFITTLFLSMGCSSISNVVDKTKNLHLPFTSDQGALRKTIGVAPFADLTNTCDRRFSKELASLVMENLASRCAGCVFVLPDHSQATLFLEDLPENVSGGTKSVLLAQMGRMAGLNGIVVMNIGGIAGDKKKSGIIGFRKVRQNVRIWVKVEVYDSNTGAKLLFDSIPVEIKLGEDEAKIDGENLSASRSAMEAIPPFAKTIAKKICTALENEPWKAFVISAENGKAVISSGQDAGIREGDVFAVYDAEKTIDNVSGRQFRIPGKMIDEIKITSVAADRSEGISVSGREIPADTLIQVKRD